MHIPSVTYNHVEHAGELASVSSAHRRLLTPFPLPSADTYADVLALAASNSSLTAYNQATFQL